MPNSVNKRIALNTIYLYLSNILQLGIGLYTSRAILQVLGVEDFGIYGIIGGVIALLGFINSAMGSASARYLTVEMVHGIMAKQKEVFTSVFIVHLAVAAIILLLGETIGLWYVNEQLAIPQTRMVAANWVYQMTVLIALIDITQVPYNSLIIAHEHMGFMSIWGSLNIVLKLVVILFLFIVDGDRLIWYSVLLFLSALFIAIGYRVYCIRKFEESRLCKAFDKGLFKELLSFASFNTFNSFATAVRVQGTSLIINKFFGVLLNAANSVANMLSSYVIMFTANVITAFRPQITKSYAVGNYKDMVLYMTRCALYTLGLYSFLAVPMLFEMDYILTLWLGKAPAHSTIFCQLTLTGSIFGLLNMIPVIAIQATANIKRNTISICVLSILAMIVMIVMFSVGFPAYQAFVVLAVINLLIFLVSIYDLKLLMKEFPSMKFLMQIVKVLVYICLGTVISYVPFKLLPSSFGRVILVSLVYVISFGSFFLFFVLEKNVRLELLKKMKFVSVE